MKLKSIYKFSTVFFINLGTGESSMDDFILDVVSAPTHSHYNLSVAENQTHRSLTPDAPRRSILSSRRAAMLAKRGSTVRGNFSASLFEPDLSIDIPSDIVGTIVSSQDDIQLRPSELTLSPKKKTRIFNYRRSQSFNTARAAQVLKNIHYRSASNSVVDSVPTILPSATINSSVAPSSRASSVNSDVENSPLRVLKLSGGGVRGLIQLYFLSKLEKETGKQVHEMFDMVIGTSIGGILSCLLTVKDPKKPEKALYSASDLLTFFNKNRDQMFKKKWFSFGGVFKTRYRATPMENLMITLLGEDKFEDRLIPTVVTAFDIVLRRAKIFDSTSQRENFSTLDVAMATSAAPTYFKPRIVMPRGETLESNGYTLVDGGVFANDPLPLAIDVAQRIFQHQLEDTIIISVDTGKSSEIQDITPLLRGGVLTWAHSILDVMFDGQNGTMDDNANQVLDLKYHGRWQPTLPAANMKLDDVSKDNASSLLTAMRIYMESRNQDFLRLANSLEKWEVMSKNKPIKRAHLSNRREQHLLLGSI